MLLKECELQSSSGVGDLFPPEDAALPSGGEELGEPVAGAGRRAGEPVSPAAVGPGAGLRNRPARHTLCSEDALCDLATV